MKRHIKTITAITLLLAGVVFILTLFDFAALHDIKKDYVSQSILHYLNISLSGDLPSWTAASGEWQVVTISYYLRFIFLVLNFAVLGYYFKKDGFRHGNI